MKRKICALLCLIGIGFNLVACAKEIDRKVEIVEGVVTDVNYRSSYMTPMYNASTKTTNFIHHPADYDVYIEYDGKTYLLDSSNAYERCIGCVGKTIECEYTTIYYDNNSTKTFLSVEGYR